MSALIAGNKAPDFTLQTTDGKPFPLRDALARGPVVLAFYKVSCPVCQYGLPFVERLHMAYGKQNVTLAGVSQNNSRDTLAFAKEYGLTFPQLLDDPSTYAVSNAYGLTNVPTLFLIAPDGEIEMSSVAWHKGEFEEINRRMAAAGAIAPASMFRPGEDVRDFRSG